MAKKRTGGSGAILSEVYDPLYAITARLEKAVGLTRDSTSLLRIPVVRLADALKESLQMQKTSLQFNRTFNQSVKKMGSSIDGLPGGLMTSMQSLFAFEQEGLGNVSRSALHLANRMQITGQNVGALVKLNKVALTKGLFNTNELSKLNQNTAELSVRFGVSTDLLVGSMAGLSKSLGVLGLTGAAPETLAAVRDLTAKFPHLGESIAEFVNVMAKGDIGKLASLGILTDADALVRGGITSKQLETLILKASAGVDKRGDFSKAGIIEAGVLQDIVGPGGVLAKQISQGMLNIPQIQPLGQEDQIFADFMTIIRTSFMPAIKSLTGALTPIVAVFGAVIGGLEKFRIVSTLVLTRVILGLTIQARELVKNGLGMKRLGLEMRALGVKASGGKVGMATMAGAMGARALLGIAVPLVGAVLITLLLPVLMGLNDSTSRLAQAESDRAKAELRLIQERRGGKSEFEAVTKVLFNQSMRNIGAAAASHVLLNVEVEKLREAVAVYTGVTEDQSAEFAMTKARTLGVLG